MCANAYGFGIIDVKVVHSLQSSVIDISQCHVQGELKEKR